MWWKLFLSVPVSLSVVLGGSNLRPGLDGNEQYLAAAPGAKLGGMQLNASVQSDPRAVYHRVWTLIKTDYYEETFNGQDWSRWERKYDSKIKTADDAHKAIETMLWSLGDRYTRFLDKDAFEDEKSQIDAKLFGIGIQIGINKAHKIIVIQPIDGTPAQKAGLESWDEIAEIDGKSTKGFTVEDAAKLIRGKIDTDVTLTIMRDKQKIKFAVKRAEIPIKAVQNAQMLGEKAEGIGYIRLSSFISQQANREMQSALEKLAPAKGVILDLRDNPGGLLSNAIEISNMFLDSGNNIVSTVDRDGYKTPAQADGHQVSRQPLVILINKSSASASEITSGALKDNGRALLVGQKTFGKGLVQGINRLPDGSGVNITIARYLTPSDSDINKKGITPDVLVDITDKDHKEGRGPWWNSNEESETKKVKRTPDDMQDVQLKAAVDAIKRQIASQSTSVATIGPRRLP